MTLKKLLLPSLLFIGIQNSHAQETFTRKDSLLGGLRKERTCFDVLRYDLNIKINPKEKSIVGYNEITFKAVETTNKIQLDLFENMQIDSIVFDSKKLSYKRDFGAVFIDFKVLDVRQLYLRTLLLFMFKHGNRFFKPIEHDYQTRNVLTTGGVRVLRLLKSFSVTNSHL